MGGKGDLTKGVRRYTVKGPDRRLVRPPGRPGARVAVDRGQAGLRRGDGQDRVRRVT